MVVCEIGNDEMREDEIIGKNEGEKGWWGI